MHIGVFTLANLNIAGGTSVRIIGITRYLQELGHKVTLFTPTFTAQLDGKTEYVCLEKRRQRSSLAWFYAGFPHLFSGLKMLPADRILLDLLQNRGIDLIHCHQHDGGFELLKVQSRLGIPLIFELHGIMRLQRHDLQYDSRFPLHVPLLLRAERNLFQRSDGLFVRTPAEAAYVKQHYRTQSDAIYIVPDGADVDFLGQAISYEDKEALRRQWKLHGKRVILFAGWFKLPSGVLDLVQAFQVLANTHLQVVLVLIGDGVLRPQIEDFIQQHRLSNVILTGIVPREHFPAYQQIADVVVTPEIKSLFNELGAPLKLFECLASGRPTVATRITSHTAIIDDGVNGFLVEPQNPQSIAEGLERALSAPDASLVGMQGRQTMVQQHSWRRSAERAVEAYTTILARTKRRR